MADTSMIARIRAAVKAWKFPGAFVNQTEPRVFWPNFPSQVPTVEFSSGMNWDESSLVMSAVNWTGTVFGEPLLKVLRQDKREGTWVEVNNHPLTKLWEFPNPNYSGATMLKSFAYYWIVYGNVYLGKRRSLDGRLRELYLLDSEQVAPRWPDDGSEFISHYEMRVDGEPAVIDKRDIIHFRYGLDPRNHRLGMSPLRALYEEILADEAAIDYSRTVLTNGGTPPWVVSPWPNADAEYTTDAEALKAEIRDRTTGSKRGEPLALSAPVKIDNVTGFKPSEMALEEMHDLPEERIASVLGIPPLVLGFGFDDHATYSNYQTALQAAWQTYVIPTLKLFASEITRQLLPEFDYRAGEWVEFDTGEIWALQEDEKGIAEREVLKYNAGISTLKEAREAMGLNPIETGEMLKVSAPGAAVPEVKQFSPSEPAEYEELRDWWEKFGPKEAREILDAKPMEE
jgi:HK97 family phage portal protein